MLDREDRTLGIPSRKKISVAILHAIIELVIYIKRKIDRRKAKNAS